MEREYTVIVNNREDLATIETELTASSGDGPIPERSVGIANPRPGSRVQTHFMLTDEEAEALRSDARIRAVEIPPEFRDDIQIGLNAIQTGRFARILPNDQDKVNWGLLRCIYETNIYEGLDNAGTVYEYALQGTGVDVVIQDSGIQADHPEWEDADGNSRLQQIDWYTASGISGTQDATFYTDFDGHGTHCAGIAAGKTYGWAKDSHIYAQKLGGLEGAQDPDNGISISDAFDTIRLWHNAKTNGRPTVVNMSWGYSTTQAGNPLEGNYRGTAWTWGTDYSDDTALWSGTGIVNPAGNGDRNIPVRLASVDAEVDDMIADGIHVAIAAGNNYYKVDLPSGPDYNNTVRYNGSSSIFYARGSSPYSLDAMMVGNINTVQYPVGGGVYIERRSPSSTNGPGVNMWAPGEGITSACSTVNRFATRSYPFDEDFRITSIGGTSMAAPQVAGVIAQHLEAFPTATPAALQARLFADAKAAIYDSGSSTDYTNSNSILGSENKFLWSRYGRQPGQISTSDTVLPAPTPVYALSASSDTVSEGTTLRITLTTQYVADGTTVDYSITGITSADLSAGTLVGTMTVNSNASFFDLTIAEDTSTEGQETMTVSLVNGPVASVSVDIADTSTTPPPETYTISVTAAGSTAYSLNGTDRNGAINTDNATVNLQQGDTVNFEVSASGHPFWIKTSESTGTGDGVPGVTNNGSEEDTVSWQPNATGTFYYICENHSSMSGQIIVS